MQKIKLLLVLGVFASIITLSSCKDDEDSVRPTLKFDDTAINVNESSGTIQIALQLDKAYSRDIEIEYEIDGTAIEGGGVSADYEIIGAFGTVDIDAGETEAFIEIQIKQDTQFEGDETIELSISDVDINDIIISEDDEIIITIRDDDTAPKVNIITTSVTQNEADSDPDAPLLIELALDNAVGSDITVTYELGGSAIDSLWGNQNDYPVRYYDYYINGNTSYANEITTGEITIPAGETTATIEVITYSDFVLEDTDNITITLKSANNGVTIGTNKVSEITLEQEDGRAIELSWNFELDVDMDLLFFLLEDGEPVYVLDITAIPSTEQFERTFLPAWFVDGEFGLSYNYYEGTANPMNFNVLFVDIIAGESEPEANWDSFDGSYTLSNINPWDTEAGIFPTPLAQTFEKVDGTFSNVTQIITPAEGSRVGSSKLKMDKVYKRIHPRSFKSVNNIKF